jgi:hypothetical protein
MFGLAMMSDISQLHDTLNDLKLQNSDIFHSLDNQLTYVKKLCATVELNVDSVTNLSAVVKDNMVWSHDKFWKFAKELVWFKIFLLQLMAFLLHVSFILTDQYI